MEYHARLTIDSITTEQKRDTLVQVEATVRAFLEFLNSKNGECEIKYTLESFAFGNSEQETIYKAMDCFMDAKLTINDIKEYNLIGSYKPKTIHSIVCEITDDYRTYFYDNFKKSEWVNKMKFIF